MSEMKDKFMSEMKGIWKWVRPKIWPVILSGGAGMLWVYAKYVPSSDLVASSPDRIIPAASRNADGTLDMAKGALNPDKLEVRVCDADEKQEGEELLLVYGEKKQLGTVGPEGYPVFTPYTAEYMWRCDL